MRAYQLNAVMSQKQAKVTIAPLSVIQSSNLSTQATTSLSSGATSSIQSVTTARQVTDDFERSKSNILHDFEYIILPKTKLLDELFKRQNIRLSRINSSIDMYFATEEVVREKLARFRKQWIATDHYREMQDVVDKLNNHLIDIQSNIYRKLDERLEKDKTSSLPQKNVSFGETTVSTFTTSSEEVQSTPTLTNTQAKDSDVNLVSGNSVSNPDAISSQQTAPVVSEMINSSHEDDFDREEKEKQYRLQRMEQRQEKAKKKAEIEQRKLKLEFERNQREFERKQREHELELERKQREHEEQMRQVEERLQLSLLEAELYSSSGEVSDKSRSSSEVESDSEKPSKISSKRHTDECSGEVEDILRVELPEESSKSTSKHNRSSFSNRLADFRKRYESDEEVENPFEMETIVESTPIGLSQMRSSPGGLSPRIRHQPQRRELFADVNPPAPPVRTHRSLPKLKLREFDGNPIDWPEWSGMFLATIDSSDISRDEKMSHLKTLLTGKAKRAVSGMGYSGTMYEEAWKTLQRKFGQPHHIVSSQLAKMKNLTELC